MSKISIKFKFKTVLQNLPNIACTGFGYAFFLTLLCKFSIFRWRSWFSVRQTSNANRWAETKVHFYGFSKGGSRAIFLFASRFLGRFTFSASSAASRFLSGFQLLVFFFASCFTSQLICSQSWFSRQVSPLFVFVLAFSQPLVSLVKLLFQQVCFTKSLFSASSWLRWPAFFEIGLRHAQGCFQGLLFRISGYTFKQATWALFRQVVSLVMQSLPNNTCSGFGLRLFLMGSFFVEFRSLAKSALGSPTR